MNYRGAITIAIGMMAWGGYPQTLAAEPAPHFEFACSAKQGRGTASTSYRQFRRWSDHLVSINGAEPMTATSVHDSMPLSFATSWWYESRAGEGGKGYVQALYDPQHRLLAACFNDDAWTALSLVANVPPPPFAVARADLSGVATRRGLVLGATVARVQAAYGHAPLIRIAAGRTELSYQREIAEPDVDGFHTSPESVETWFAIVNDRVRSISIGTGF